MVMRILLLLSLSWIMGLTAPLFTVPLLGHEVSGRDLVLIVGGLFLVAKSTHEIHDKLEGHEGEKSERVARVLRLGARADHGARHRVLARLGDHRGRHGAARHDHDRGGGRRGARDDGLRPPIGDFVARRPTVKMLALAFLLVIGMMLIADGFGHHVPKGYIYFAMAFSLFVEMLNLRAGHREEPVHLRQPYVPEGDAPKPGPTA